MKILLLLLLFSSAISFAQNKYVRGTIRDYSTGEPLPFANIIVKNSASGNSADENGIYQLTLTPAKYDLLFTYIGYRTETIAVEVASENLELNISLVATGVLLQEVSVYSSDKSEVNSISSLSMQSKQMEEISSVAPDVFRSIQALPGIAVNNEFSAKFNVRGGNYDENLVLVNGTQVYEPFHIKEADNASVGIFNIDLMRKVNIMTGGFSAQYGDRMSSVLNIEYREGNKNKHTGSSTLSLIYADATLEGPLTSKGTYIIGLRKSYLKYIMGFLDVNDAVKPDFYDVQGVITYYLTDANKLQLKFIHAGDNFTEYPGWQYRPQSNFNGYMYNDYVKVSSGSSYIYDKKADYYSNLFDLQNTMFISNSALINTSLSYYEQTDKEYFHETGKYRWEAAGRRFYSYYSNWEDLRDNNLKIRTWEAKTQLDVKLNPFFDIKTGISYINVNYNQNLIDEFANYITDNANNYPDTIRTTLVDPDNTREKIETGSFKLAGYMENVFQINENIIVNAGARIDYFDFNRDMTLSPRLSASYRLNSLNFRAAWGHYYQSPIYRQLAYSTPSDTNTQSQKCEQYILSAENNFSFDNDLTSMTFKVEGFYKKYSDLISSERDEGGNIIYSRRNDSKGRTYGIDFYLTLRLPWYYGWISYGYLVAKEDLLTDNKGEFPRYTDQRHTISIVNDFDLGKGWRSNLRFTYGSGFAYTPLVAEYNTLERKYEWNEGNINSEHLPAYKRVDVRISKQFSIFELPTIVFLDINNVFDFKNIYLYDYRFNENGYPIKREIELFPLIPSMGITVNF